MNACYRLLGLIFLLLSVSRANAYLIEPLDTAWLLEQAPLACRVRVLSVRTIPGSDPSSSIGFSIGGGYSNQDGVATVAVSRVLKGTCPQQITIAVHTGEDGEGATRLHPGEWAIVLLAPLKVKNAITSVNSPQVREAADYVLFPPVNGTLEIPAPTKVIPVVETEKDPQRRLLDELVQAAENKAATPLMFQRAIEQLGKWAAERDRRNEDVPPFGVPIPITKEPRVAKLLPRLRARANHDPITYGLYQTTALQWGVLPTVPDAVRVLSGKPTPGAGPIEFPIGDQPFTLPGVQQTFVYALRIRYRPHNKPDAFDDAAFCHAAFHQPSVRQSTELREEVGAVLYAAHSPRSIPDAASLLYDKSQTLRSIGVNLLRSLVEHIPDRDTSGLPYEVYVKKEPALLRHWKAWWEAQPEREKTR